VQTGFNQLCSFIHLLFHIIGIGPGADNHSPRLEALGIGHFGKYRIAHSRFGPEVLGEGIAVFQGAVDKFFHESLAGLFVLDLAEVLSLELPVAPVGNQDQIFLDHKKVIVALEVQASQSLQGCFPGHGPVVMEFQDVIAHRYDVFDPLTRIVLQSAGIGLENVFPCAHCRLR